MKTYCPIPVLLHLPARAYLREQIQFNESPTTAGAEEGRCPGFLINTKEIHDSSHRIVG